MTQTTRIVIGIVVLVVIVGAVLGIDALRRQNSSTPVVYGQQALAPGSIPIYVNNELVGGFTPDDLSELKQVGFIDAEEGKTQEGWLLRDVLLRHIERDALEPDTPITISSSSRSKMVQLTWDDVDQADNMVMFDLSARGTLKLVSTLPQLDVRDEWVQDVDKIEIETGP